MPFAELARKITNPHMADIDEPEKIWDEYDWERFLQQQDRKTEKYMELLERYIDDPNRDQIIAREMGWYHLLDKDGEKWAENVDSTIRARSADDDGGRRGEAAKDGEEGFEVHPLYQASFALTVWIDQLFEELGDVAKPARRGEALDAGGHRQRQARGRTERRRRGRNRHDHRVPQARAEGDR